MIIASISKSIIHTFIYISINKQILILFSDFTYFEQFPFREKKVIVHKTLD